ncbi:pyruvate, phosphate dikinase [Alkalicoccus urumqiensis]|uniref:Pyruvate, phosphate dikinase n=1 Tax=Alkalicoccus urumqiensis TaxID=1548213 RepID=A0A2P6MJ17_ALKUR|nr:pyruvate, phosphate dikinase [Alkalicoccus urumqiensis]PRO66294.1 pyruvate, phosphate dikinase [Alkalicoccus urumqiensis]
MTKFVYAFSEGSRDMKKLLGGKGSNLAEMVKIGLPVPPGFTVSTEACRTYDEQGQKLTEEIKTELAEAVRRLEKDTGKRIGDTKSPLFVSVRSGAVFSMPGMMDTVLNLGMNDDTARALAEQTGEPRFALDSYRRFLQMFGDVVLGVETERFERELERFRAQRGYTSDPELTADDWKTVISVYKKLIEHHTGSPFPQDPNVQLQLSVEAVFQSWNNERAAVYRRMHGIPHSLGTAVTVQSMVFGNLGDTSGTGVAFTRNPSNGKKELYGEYLINAQGEDVVAGIRTPQPIRTLHEAMPDVYDSFVRVTDKLEHHYRDMQDIEFTIEDGTLYILQTRNGKRTSQAALQIAVDMVEEGVLTKEEALLRVDADQLHQLLHRRISGDNNLQALAKGLPASPGAASGRMVFSADEAESWAEAGEKVILVRPETTPDDIHGIISAEAVLTTRGGMTSHAAVVARGMGKTCICGCEAADVDIKAETMTIDGTMLKKGDVLTLDGGTGEVFSGSLQMEEPEMSPTFQLLLGWADSTRRMNVRANADNGADAAKAVEFGAEGIGLCRTEHMFMDPARIPVVRRMILADSKRKREEALAELLPMQRQDFEEIFEAMEGRPVTIRLLDPPLHEFLPDKEELLIEVTTLELTGDAPEKLAEKKQLLDAVKHLEEANPMLGHRGCRLGMTHPEIYAMQAEAIFLAAGQVHAKPEIMVPLVSHVNELKAVKAVIEREAERVQRETGVHVDYTIGTMIEVPRAALTAAAIAEEADFFSFGTNDLTQTTFGFSRDDAEGKFLRQYVDQETLEYNPFVRLDEEGVGRLVEIGAHDGRSVKPELKLGICGEHGGNAKSIHFCETKQLDYVSCSPFRVPAARLAAAQAAIMHQAEKEVQPS